MRDILFFRFFTALLTYSRNEMCKEYKETGKKSFSIKRMMLLGVVLLLFVCPSPLYTTPIGVIANARFDSIDSAFQLINVSSVSNQLHCICQCSTDSMCVTASYLGVSQLCSLFSAQLQQGQLTAVVTNQQTSTFTFLNRSVVGE